MAGSKKRSSKGKERPPPVDKLIKPAIGIGLALLAYQFFNGIKSEVCQFKHLTIVTFYRSAAQLIAFPACSWLLISFSIFRFPVLMSMMKWNWERSSLEKGKERTMPFCVILRMPSILSRQSSKMLTTTAVHPPNSEWWTAIIYWAVKRTFSIDSSWRQNRILQFLFLEKLAHPNKWVFIIISGNATTNLQRKINILTFHIASFVYFATCFEF